MVSVDRVIWTSLRVTVYQWDGGSNPIADVVVGDGAGIGVVGDGGAGGGRELDVERLVGLHRGVAVDGDRDGLSLASIHRFPAVR